MKNVDGIDYRQLSIELMRTIRARRSTNSLSKRLGFGTNVINGWESGRRSPTVSNFMRLASMCGIDVVDAVAEFMRPKPTAWLPPSGREWNAQHTAMFLQDVRAGTPYEKVAETAGFKAHTVRRWLAAETEPRLGDFIQLIDTWSSRGLLWVARFADPSLLPSVAELWEQFAGYRQLCRENPWAIAVSYALVLSGYQALERHSDEWLAHALGISTDLVQSSLKSLADLGLCSFKDGKWERHPGRSVLDFSDLDEAGQWRRKASWARVAYEAMDRKVGEHHYFVFATSEEGMALLKKQQVEFCRSLAYTVRELHSQKQEPLEVMGLWVSHFIPLKDEA